MKIDGDRHRHRDLPLLHLGSVDHDGYGYVSPPVASRVGVGANMEAPPRVRRGRVMASGDGGQAGSSSLNPINPPPALYLLRDDIGPKLLLESAGNSAADGVLLPSGRGDDLVEAGALGTAQHGDEVGLLGAGACGR